jgi:secreted Zn-dependent insulinase-like peptidase
VEGRDARGEVVEWYGREYDAGRMKLCVVGNGE